MTFLVMFTFYNVYILHGQSLKISKRFALGVRMRKSGSLGRAQLVDLIQGFRIPDRVEAREKNEGQLSTNLIDLFKFKNE